MTDFKDLLSSAKQMKEKMELAQEALKKLEVTGEAGGSFAVRVTLNGEGQLIKIDFDDSLLKEPKEIILDLIKAGHDQAIKNLASKKAEEIQKITGGIGLPPNFKFPFQ